MPCSSSFSRSPDLVATEIFRNPSRLRGGQTGPPTTDVRAFHRRLDGYAPTPLRRMPEMASELGLSDLWVKDESSRFGLPSFKVLGASWATYRVLVAKLADLGIDEPAWSDLDELRAALAPLGPLTLAAATDGNHGRAVAYLARTLGLSARIFVPGGMAPARIDAIAGEGASVVVVPGTYDDAVEASAVEPEVVVVSDTSWPGYTEVPGWVIEGYGTIFAEVDEQLGGTAPDLVVVQMGVGSLCAAAVSAYAHRSAVVAVEPTSAACGMRSAEHGAPTFVPGPHDSIMSGLNCGHVSRVAWPTVAAGVDVFVAIDDGPIPPAMRDLARIGVVAGETGAAGLAGLRAFVAADTEISGKSALVLCTEGATDPEVYARIVDTS